MTRLLGAVLGLLVLLGLFACGEDAAPAADDPARIGPDGGVFSDQGVTLRIPPGALSETVRLSVHPVGSPQLSDFEPVGAFVRLEPSQVLFAEPVPVEFLLDAALLPEGRRFDELRLISAPEFSFPFSELETETDPNGSTLSSSLESLGILGAALERKK